MQILRSRIRQIRRLMHLLAVLVFAVTEYFQMVLFALFGNVLCDFLTYISEILRKMEIAKHYMLRSICCIIYSDCSTI